MSSNIKQITNKFNIEKATRISKFGNGLINDTYLIERTRSKYILQKLHPIFKPTVLIDTYNVTQYLLTHSLVTPVLVKTRDGKLCYTDDRNNYWRVLTYVPGRCYELGVSPKKAFSAGQLIGKFHNILSRFDYKFKHKIKNFQNPEARIKKLKLTLKKFQGTRKYKYLASLAGKVFQEYDKLGTDSNSLPDRVIHGDLKINNIRFDMKGNAVCLLDLDTLGRHKIVTDLAGAARTWCNRTDEGDIKNSKFNLLVFENMLKGYSGEAKFITKNEIRLIPEAIERTVLVLVARFITDAFEEKYFRLNPKQYSNLYEQNKAKATAQMVLYDDLKNKKKKINNIIKNLCK